MEHTIEHYELLAGLFGYPDPDLPEKAREIQALLDARYPELDTLCTRPLTANTVGFLIFFLEKKS